MVTANEIWKEMRNLPNLLKSPDFKKTQTKSNQTDKQNNPQQRKNHHPHNNNKQKIKPNEHSDNWSDSVFSPYSHLIKRQLEPIKRERTTTFHNMWKTVLECVSPGSTINLPLAIGGGR